MQEQRARLRLGEAMLSETGFIMQKTWPSSSEAGRHGLRCCQRLSRIEADRAAAAALAELDALAARLSAAGARDRVQRRATTWTAPVAVALVVSCALAAVSAICATTRTAPVAVALAELCALAAVFPGALAEPGALAQPMSMPTPGEWRTDPIFRSALGQTASC